MPNPHRRGMLAVAFGPPTMAAALAGLPQIRAAADCVELRLDLFHEAFDLPLLLEECGDLPVVATLRPPDQGGGSPLSAGERLAVLVRAAELGAAYIDLEWDAASPEAIAALRGAGASVVVSRHDFSEMPPRMAVEWWPQLASLGADVVKVVGTARRVEECLPIFRAFGRANLPTIAIAMGSAGLLTRVLALREAHCLLTYASLGHASATAPGQITVDEMRQTYAVERLQPTTRVYGLLGPHAEPARLAEYNAWFVQDDWDGVAVPFEAAADSDAAGIVTAFRELPAAGWHIHGSGLQAGVVSALDELSATAARHARANAVVCRADGALIGHWVESPREQYQVWRADA